VSEEIFREVDDDLRQDQYFKLWKQYGRFLVGAAVGVVVATAVWQGYAAWERGRNESYSERFIAALQMLQDIRKHFDVYYTAGQAMAKAVGDKKGIERYGFYYVTMDEALARCALDLSGRVSFVWNAPIPSSRVGNLDIELVSHFFSSVAENAKMNLHLDLLRGTNSHHCVEALFKAFARALSMAVSPSRRVMGVPSTKASFFSCSLF